MSVTIPTRVSLLSSLSSPSAHIHTCEATPSIIPQSGAPPRSILTDGVCVDHQSKVLSLQDGVEDLELGVQVDPLEHLALHLLHGIIQAHLSLSTAIITNNGRVIYMAPYVM